MQDYAWLSGFRFSYSLSLKLITSVSHTQSKVFFLPRVQVSCVCVGSAPFWIWLGWSKIEWEWKQIEQRDEVGKTTLSVSEQLHCVIESVCWNIFVMSLHHVRMCWSSGFRFSCLLPYIVDFYITLSLSVQRFLVSSSQGSGQLCFQRRVPFWIWVGWSKINQARKQTQQWGEVRWKISSTSLRAAVSVIESVRWKYICESLPRTIAIDHLGFKFSHILSDIHHCCITLKLN
jgi:hypothetical protein